MLLRQAPLVGSPVCLGTLKAVDEIYRDRHRVKEDHEEDHASGRRVMVMAQEEGEEGQKEPKAWDQHVAPMSVSQQLALSRGSQRPSPSLGSQSLRSQVSLASPFP